MSELEEILKYGTFVGIVEDNEDPDKKQRVKIRIPFLHGKSNEIPTEALPWAQPFRDMNGLTCVIPDKAKIVNVTFPWGNAYYPVYDSAEHLNINLQKKLEEYSGEDYTNFIALLYNHNTQIYVDNQKGLFLRHKFNEINLSEDGIALNLKDNNSTLFIGDDKGDQEALLATHFMEWFDTLMQTLMDAYIGNSGAPVIANPNLINVFTNYQAKRSTFLSQHVYITDNNKINREKLKFEDKKGDEIEQTVKSSKVTVTTKPITYEPKPPRVKEEIPVNRPQDNTTPPNEIKPIIPLVDVGDELISLDQLRYVTKNKVAENNLKDAHKALNYTMKKYDITTPLRISHFLAQLLHESGSLRFFKELGKDDYFTKYEGRTDLGNHQPGDGIKFKGRGAIQLTGRDVYTKISQAFNMDFINNSHELESTYWGVVSAGWFWSVYKKSRKFNLLADNDDFVAITKGVNGGDNGILDRKQKLDLCKQAYNIPITNEYVYDKKIKGTNNLTRVVVPTGPPGKLS